MRWTELHKSEVDAVQGQFKADEECHKAWSQDAWRGRRRQRSSDPWWQVCHRSCVLSLLLLGVFGTLTLLIVASERASGLQKVEWWGAGVVICLERGVYDFHVVQLMPLPSPIISCFIKIFGWLIHTYNFHFISAFWTWCHFSNFTFNFQNPNS